MNDAWRAGSFVRIHSAANTSSRAPLCVLAQADFGTSRRTAHTRGSLTTRVGTIAYMPPECLQTFGLLGYVVTVVCVCASVVCVCAVRSRCVVNRPTGDNTSICGEKWDVYSLGILLNFIVTERTPHENLFDNQIVRQVGVAG